MKNFERMSRKQDQGDEHATQWLKTFDQLFEVLNIRVNDHASVPQV